MARQVTWGALALIGAAAFLMALGFGWGDGPRIGSAPVPALLAAGLAAVAVWGVLTPATGDDGGPSDTAPEWRPFGAVAAGVVLFILTVDWLGLIPAVLACMAAAYLGQTERRYAGFLLYAVPFAVGVWALFSLGLGLPVPAFGG